MKKFTGSIFVFLGGASYGLLSTLVKLAYQNHFLPAEVTGSQVLFGCLGLWIMSIPVLQHLRSCSWITILKLIGSGTFLGLTAVFYYISLQTLSSSLAVILLFQFVWIGILLEWFLQRHAPTRNRWIALLCVWVGTILAAGYHAVLFARIDFLGVCFGLLAAFCYALAIQVSGRVATEVQPLLRSALMVSGAAIITLIVFPPAFVVNGALERGLWVWSVLLGFFGMVLPPFLLNKGTPAIGVSLATILSSIELPIVILLSALVLKENIQLSQWSGVILILLGIVIAERQFGLKT